MLQFPDICVHCDVLSYCDVLTFDIRERIYGMQVDDAQIDRMSMRTGVPLYDPVWHATYQV